MDSSAVPSGLLPAKSLTKDQKVRVVKILKDWIIA
jgi:hypothetical protein